MDGGSVPEAYNKCFYQIVDFNILKNNDTFVYLEGNIATITGYAIYAADVKNCIMLITSYQQLWEHNENFTIAYSKQFLHMCFILKS